MVQRTLISIVKPKPADWDIEQDFDACFHIYWSKVHGILSRLVSDPDEAEDLALEVFWRLYQQRQTFRQAPIENLGGWLYRVAANLGYNALRADRRRRQYEQVASQNEDFPMGRSDPVVEAEIRQQQKAVHQALSRRKKRSAQALILRHSGLSYAEVAAALHISPGSVGTLLARAGREFEQVFQQLEGHIRL